MDDKDLDRLIQLAHEIADKQVNAWRFCTRLLAFLLVLSFAANIFLAMSGPEINLGTYDTVNSEIHQENHN